MKLAIDETKQAIDETKQPSARIVAQIVEPEEIDHSRLDSNLVT